MSDNIVTLVREDLKQNIDQKAADGYQRYFKEEVIYYGVRGAVIKKIAANHYKSVRNLDKQALFALCESLLESDYGEEAAVAFNWVYRIRNTFELSDFQRFEAWIENYVNSWAKCDDFCNHTVAALVEKFPELIQELKRWGKSDNRWFRRAAAVTLILPARHGDYLDDVFEIADILLTDEDDLVRKGYGWMLKEASKLHQQEVFDYVVSHKDLMPRTALRYAIEKMPADLKKEAMKK